MYSHWGTPFAKVIQNDLNSDNGKTILFQSQDLVLIKENLKNIETNLKFSFTYVINVNTLLITGKYICKIKYDIDIEK